MRALLKSYGFSKEKIEGAVAFCYTTDNQVEREREGGAGKGGREGRREGRQAGRQGEILVLHD